MAALTKEQMKQVYHEVKVEHREPVNAIVRYGGDKEDYQNLYKLLRCYA